MALVSVVLLLSAAGCGEDRTPRDIRFPEAESRESTELTFEVGVCRGDTKISVKETRTRIELTAVASSDTDDKCASTGTVTLAAPIGDRVIVDTTSGQELTLTFTRP